MSKLYTGKIDVTKIQKDKLFKGEKGTYLNVAIWINDEPDQFGNTMSVQQQTGKDEAKIYLGNLKEFKKESNTGEQAVGEVDDLPF
jgi:hypothetical protein